MSLPVIKYVHMNHLKCNFLVSGHFNDVYMYKVAKSDSSLIKSSVLPSQRQGLKETLYNIWISLHKTGQIPLANCTCMAG